MAVCLCVDTCLIAEPFDDFHKSNILCEMTIGEGETRTGARRRGGICRVELSRRIAALELSLD